MAWKTGKVIFDDGSTYPAQMLLSEDGQIWNVRIRSKDGKIIEEIDPHSFASKFDKRPDDVYPYTFKIED